MTGWSEAETTALATRAARGAGLPPGQAILYGAASAHHLAAGRDPHALAAALSDPQIPSLITRIASLAPGPHSAPDHPLTDALLAALPGHATRSHYDPDTPAPHRAPARVDPPPDLIALWHDCAAKTYVPESEASRANAGGAED
ncbi:MAG: hypothetical protein AAGM84_16745 [Pseudomonadota bacterium]